MSLIYIALFQMQKFHSVPTDFNFSHHQCQGSLIRLDKYKNYFDHQLKRYVLNIKYYSIALINLTQRQLNSNKEEPHARL